MIIRPKKTNLKVGDTVKIISGRYKSQVSKIKKIIYKKNSVIIENINLKTKYIKPNNNEESGRIQKVEKPIHRSNIKKYNNTNK